MSNTAAFSRLFLSLGWDKDKDSSIDLDASVISFDRNRRSQRVIYFNNQSSEDQSIQLSKDNLDGAGDGDDEKVTFHLTQVSPEITDIFCLATVYNDPYTFANATNAFIRLGAIMSEGSAEKELMRMSLGNLGSETALIFAKISRVGYGQEWKVERIGQTAKGRRGPDLVDHIHDNYLERSVPSAPPPKPKYIEGKSPLGKRKTAMEQPTPLEIRCFLCGSPLNQSAFNGEAILTSPQPIFLSCHECYLVIIAHKKNFTRTFAELPIP